MKSQWWPLGQVPVQRTVSQDVGNLRLKKKTDVKPEPKVEVKLEEKKEPSPKGTLSLALQRIHDKLQSPTELLKLHLKHYHMTTEQFKRRTSALKLPKDIYDKFDQITKSCEHMFHCQDCTIES